MTTAERMAAAAADWLASLTPEQRRKAQRPVSDTAERLRWFYVPTEQGGLPLAEMDSAGGPIAQKRGQPSLSALGRRSPHKGDARAR